MLLALKYRNRRDALAFFAAEIAALVDAGADILTWVPTTAARRRARGFDQAELLARGVGRRTGVPVRSLLHRIDGRAQTGQDALARREGPEFAVRRGRAVATSVVLIDDIGTTVDALDEESAVDDWLRRRVGDYVHAASSCRMGPIEDPGAVVDTAGRVHGYVNLRVGDASIMPDLPAANLHLPTMMVAERIARSISADARA